jgi:uncharacterized protein YciI
VELESFTFVLLRRPPAAPDLPEKRLEEIQEQHLAHLAALHDRGVLLLAGPFDDQPDEALRGMCILSTTLEETRAIMAEDPAVVAGRLVVDVMTWWTQRGSLGTSESS